MALKRSGADRNASVHVISDLCPCLSIYAVLLFVKNNIYRIKKCLVKATFMELQGYVNI